MKISIISAAWPFRGGIANFTALLYKELIRGNDVKVYNFTRQYPSILFPGKTQLETEKTSLEIPTERTIDSINPFTWIKTGKKIRDEKPDFLVIKYWIPFFAPAFGKIAKIVKSNGHTKIVAVCHNIIPHEKKPGDLALAKYLFNSVDKFVILSKTVENDLTEIKPDADYKVLYHPVYSHFGETVPREEALSRLGISDKKNILFFGFIRDYKGLDILIKACAILKQKLDYNLIVAGEFYSNEEKYISLISSEGMEENIILHSDFIPAEKVKYYFSASDVVVLPYRSATQSGIVQAAYNFYKPVIATRVGGLSEIVKDGGNGILVEPENPEALAEAILSYFKSENKDNFTQKIREYQEEFSWERFNTLFTEFLNQ